MENLGTRLRKLRKEHDDTQQVLADIAGVTKQAISKIESKGVIDSAGATLEPIARHYGVTVRWLTTGEGPKYLPDKLSQSARLDPAMLVQTHRALRRIYEQDLGRSFNLEDDPVRFMLAYELRSRMSPVMTEDELIEFGTKLVDIVARQGALGDGRSGERNHGLPANGPDQGDMAGRVQRKKSRPKVS